MRRETWLAECCGARYARRPRPGDEGWLQEVRCAICGRDLSWRRGPGTTRRRATVDRTMRLYGRAKRARIDLGLELLRVRSRPGEGHTLWEIAAWCGCSDAYIRAVEQRALRKVRRALAARPDLRRMFEDAMGGRLAA